MVKPAEGGGLLEVVRIRAGRRNAVESPRSPPRGLTHSSVPPASAGGKIREARPGDAIRPMVRLKPGAPKKAQARPSAGSSKDGRVEEPASAGLTIRRCPRLQLGGDESRRSRANGDGSRGDGSPAWARDLSKCAPPCVWGMRNSALLVTSLEGAARRDCAARASASPPREARMGGDGHHR